MLLIPFVWIFIAIGIGLYARKVGLKFWTYFLIATFFTPLVAAIVFAVESQHLPQKKRRPIEPKDIQINKPLK